MIKFEVFDDFSMVVWVKLLSHNWIDLAELFVEIFWIEILVMMRGKRERKYLPRSFAWLLGSGWRRLEFVYQLDNVLIRSSYNNWQFVSRSYFSDLDVKIK